MIRIFNKQLVAVESGSVYVADIYCDSSDTKPTTELANGSTLTEVDTGKKYLFNEATTSWVEVSGGGGNNNEVNTYSGATLDGAETALGTALTSRYGGETSTTVPVAYQTIKDDIRNGNLSIVLTLDLSNLGGAYISLPFGLDENVNIGGYFANISANPAEVDPAFSATLHESGSQGGGITILAPNITYKGFMGGSVVDMGEYSSLIGYILNIYWHEMPTD